MNRYYSAQMGRFLSADPYQASGGPGDPGSWNRYAYVEGDPVNLNDSLGLAGTETTYGPPPGMICNTYAGSLCGMFSLTGGLYSAAAANVNLSTDASYNPNINKAIINGVEYTVGGGSTIGYGGIGIDLALNGDPSAKVDGYLKTVRRAFSEELILDCVIVKVNGWVAGDDVIENMKHRQREGEIRSEESRYVEGKVTSGGLDKFIGNVFSPGDPLDSRPFPSMNRTAGVQSIPTTPAPVTIRPPTTGAPPKGRVAPDHELLYRGGRGN